jgi:hypothetical protein
MDLSVRNSALVISLTFLLAIGLLQSPVRENVDSELAETGLATGAFSQGSTVETQKTDSGPDLQESLESYWRFDERNQSLKDHSGNNKGLKFSSDALYFDGSDDYIRVDHSEELDFNDTQDWSISVWFKPKLDGTPQVIAGKGDGAHVDGWTLRDDWGGGNLFFRGNDTELRASNIWDGEWHHAVVSVSEEELDLYVDGELRDSSSRKPFGPFNQTSPLLIGDKGNGEYFNGSIADIRVFGKALSSKEASELYRGDDNGLKVISHWTLRQKGKEIPDHESKNSGTWHSPSTEAVYDFERVQGRTLYDRTPRSNEGTLGGIADGTITLANWSSGKIGHGISLNQSSKVTVENRTEFKINDHTISFWIKRTSKLQDDYETIFHNGEGGTADDGTGGRLPQIYFLSNGEGGLHWRWSTDVDGNDGINTEPGTVPLNEWTHLVGVKDGKNLTIYRNGEYFDSTQLSSNKSGNGYGDITLRGDGRNNVTFKLDEVKLFSSTVSEEAIGKLYKSGLNKLRIDPELENPKVLDINFDYVNSTEVLDTSARGNHGEEWSDVSRLNERNCRRGKCYNFSSGTINITNWDFFGGFGNTEWNGGAGKENWTSMAWIYPRKISQGDCEDKFTGGDIIAQGGESNDIYYFHVCEGSKIALYLDGSSVQVTSPEGKINPERWYHVAVTGNRESGLKLYVNGQKVDEDLSSYTLTGSNQPVTIGGEPRRSSWFKGRIDNVKIFNKTLEREEIVEKAELNETDQVYNFSDSKVLDLGLEENNGDTTYSHANIVEGVSGKGYKFDGIDDHIDIPADPSLEMSQETFTQSFWAKGEYNGTARNAIRMGGGWQTLVGIYSEDTWRAGFYGNSSNGWKWISAVADTSKWHHIVFVKRPNVEELWIDGQKLDTRSTSEIPPQSRDGGAVIGSVGGNDRPYKGTIDEVKISSRALEEDEIKNLYRTQRADFATPSADKPIENLAGQEGILSTKAFEFNTRDEEGVAKDVFQPRKSFTFSTWVRNSENWGEELGTIWQSSNGRVFIRDDPRKIWGDGLVFGWYSNGRVYGLTPETNLRKDEWYHIAATYDSNKGEYQLYINGKRQKGKPSISDQVRESGVLKLASDTQLLGSGEWHGKLDETRLYSRHLTNEEIKRLAFQ